MIDARLPTRAGPRAAGTARDQRYLPNNSVWGKRVYAICFDLDTEVLQDRYHNQSRQNAYEDIRRVLSRHGFERQQGSVYFGDETVDPVRCVLAIQDVARECPWFRPAAKDVRMLRIEDNNDLAPAIDLGAAAAE